MKCAHSELLEAAFVPKRSAQATSLEDAAHGSETDDSGGFIISDGEVDAASAELQSEGQQEDHRENDTDQEETNRLPSRKEACCAFSRTSHHNHLPSYKAVGPDSDEEGEKYIHSDEEEINQELSAI